MYFHKKVFFIYLCTTTPNSLASKDSSKMSVMKIETFVFNAFYENTYVISSSKGNALIFDPGCYESFEFSKLFEYIKSENLTVKGIVNTHCHIDHILGNSKCKNEFGVKLMIPVNEQEILRSMIVYAPQWGITAYEHTDADQLLSEKDHLILDDIHFKILEVPGHSPGHLMFYCKEEKTIIGGDVLFKESIGRTDLPGGDHENLLTNIQNKVYKLPDDTTVFCGHGPNTTIGHEKRHNPFVKG